MSDEPRTPLVAPPDNEVVEWWAEHNKQFSPAELEANKNPGEVMSDPIVPSPNGTPVMPSWLGPALTVLGTVALGLEHVFAEGSIGYVICDFVVKICAVAGPASAGWRK